MGATAALMRGIDMLRDMLPGTPDPLGVRFSSAGIFVLVIRRLTRASNVDYLLRARRAVARGHGPQYSHLAHRGISRSGGDWARGDPLSHSDRGLQEERSSYIGVLSRAEGSAW